MSAEHSRLDARLARVRAVLADEGLDALALAPSDNLRHSTGFSPLADERFCALLLTADAEALVVPELNADQAAAALPEIEQLRFKDQDGPTAALQAALAKLDGGSVASIAVDPEMRADALLALRDCAPDVRLVSAAPVMRRLRETKQADEIEAIRRAAAVADRAMAAAVGACRPGVSENDVAAAVLAAFRAAGADEPWVSVCSGPNGAFPHHEHSERVLRDGEPIVVDLGARLGDYHSDMTRMVHLGEPSARYREVHEIVERASQAALRAATVGATCGDVDRAARDVISDAGYGERFLHRTGHGLGLSLHEAPWIMAGDEHVLGDGAVFSIEPGIYLPDEFGVRLEEIVVLTPSGAQIVSGLDRAVAVVAT
jgi:Xaa-Pro aminopeptidase